MFVCRLLFFPLNFILKDPNCFAIEVTLLLISYSARPHSNILSSWAFETELRLKSQLPPDFLWMRTRWNRKIVLEMEEIHFNSKSLKVWRIFEPRFFSSTALTASSLAPPCSSPRQRRTPSRWSRVGRTSAPTFFYLPARGDARKQPASCGVASP